MKFNHLNVPSHWQNYWTRYPEGHTILEALISWVSQVDSMVDNVNEWNDYLDGFVESFDSKLHGTVTDILNDWQHTGFLKLIINEALQWQLDGYITTNEQDKFSINQQLDQVATTTNSQLAGKVDKNGNEQITMAMLSTEIKGAINGGDWNVSVNTSDIENGAVNHLKLNGHYNYDPTTNFIQDGDLNTILDTGLYLLVGGTNKPPNSSHTALLQVDANDGKSYVIQTLYSMTKEKHTYARKKSANMGGVFTNWINMYEVGTDDILNDAVTAEKTDFIHVSKNLFNHETLTPGYINIYTGGVSPSNNNYTSDFIPLNGKNTVYFSPYAGLVVNIAFYTSSKVFKFATSSVDLGSGYYKGSGRFTLPTSLIDINGYFRISTNSLSDFMVNYESSALPYEPYGKKIKKEYLDIPQNSVSPLKDYQIINFGDSIFGNVDDNTSVSSAVSNRTGGTVLNIGFGGSRVAEHYQYWDAFSWYRLIDEIVKPDSDDTKWQLQDEAITAMKGGEPLGMPAYFEQRLERLKAIDFSKKETIVTFAAGTNDFDSNRVDVDNPLNKEDTTTYGGSLRYGLRKLQEKYPHIKILLCTPIYRFWTVDGVVTEDSDERVVKNQKLTDFVEKTIEIGREFKLPVLDNYYELGINTYNKFQYFPTTDGTHPNANGRELMGNKIGGALIDNY